MYLRELPNSVRTMCVIVEVGGLRITLSKQLGG